AQARGKGMTPTQLDHLLRRQERSQRSYLAAIRTLATVRKLTAPAPTAAAPAAAAVKGAGPGRRLPEVGRGGGVAASAARPAARPRHSAPHRGSVKAPATDVGPQSHFRRGSSGIPEW